jgi:hypothetical protein
MGRLDGGLHAVRAAFRFNNQFRVGSWLRLIGGSDCGMGGTWESRPG